MNLPNKLTVSRLILTVFFLVALLFDFPFHYTVALVFFVAASLTDLFDGIIARRRNLITAFGKLMDPLADKLLITAALVSLVQMELAPAWMVAVILGRELGVTVLRSVAYSRGITISASPLGKVKMMSQVVAILLLILGRENLQGFFVLGNVALWVVVVTSLVSAADYYRRFTQVRSRSDVSDFEAARERATSKKASGTDTGADQDQSRIASHF